MRYLILTVVLGCAGSHELDTSLMNVCSADEGLTMVEGHDGTLVEAVSACAVCRRAENGFNARAAELGCAAVGFPHECPLGDAQGCYAWQAELFIDFLQASEACDTLFIRAANLRNWGGFECGGPYCFAPPFFDDTHHSDRCER